MQYNVNFIGETRMTDLSSSSIDDSSSSSSTSSESGSESESDGKSAKRDRTRGRSHTRRSGTKRSRRLSDSTERKRKTKKRKKRSKQVTKQRHHAHRDYSHNSKILSYSTAAESRETTTDAKEVLERLWSIRATNSTMYKFIQASSNITTKDLISKVAKLFNLKQHLISLSFEFEPSPGAGKQTIEIEEGDEDSFQHALQILPNYSRITVETRIAKMKEVAIPTNNRCARTKEVVSEEIKREMGLHNDEGKGKKGYLDAKWTDRCDRLIEEDTRFLFEYDKVQAGVELAWGDKRYLLNPFQMICPVCGNVKCLGNMNQPSSLLQHMTTQHPAQSAIACVKRLKAWVQNHFISKEQLNAEASLPEGLFDPTTLLSTPRVRAAVLTRDIL